MNLSRDRQGFLEDVNSMTLPQLKDLLKRQENILSKKKFVANLPDKGEKSKQFVEKLRDIIAARSSGNISSKSGSSQRFSDESDEVIKDKEMKTIETLLTRNETDISYRSISNESMETNPSTDLAQQMQELSVGGDPITEIPLPTTNSYERVIKKVEENPFTTTKFLPNRSKKDKSSGDSPSTRTKPQPTNVREESALYPPNYSDRSAKLISIDESVILIEEQRIKAEQIAAERAAQRLAEHFTNKMEPYQPSRVDMRYRQPKVDEDNDDDSDENAYENNDEDSDDIASEDEEKDVDDEL